MAFLLRRLMMLVITVLIVSLFIFIVFQVLPGDPALTILGVDAEEEQVQALREKMGLDQPLLMRYVSWLMGALHGDLGESLRFSTSVSSLIVSRLSLTFLLSTLSLSMTVLVAIPLGILVARMHGRWVDILISIATQIGMAVPSFWLGILFILLFSVLLHWFVPGQYVPWQENLLASIKSLFVPALAIAVPEIALIMRYVRTAIIEQLPQDYVRTARSKGLKELNVYYIHILKNALIPILTIVGMVFANIMAGTLIVEQVFALPGIGRLLVSSISYRDFPLIQGIVLYISFIVVVVNFIVDLLYVWIDPRIRLQ